MKSGGRILYSPWRVESKVCYSFSSVYALLFPQLTLYMSWMWADWKQHPILHQRISSPITAHTHMSTYDATKTCGLLTNQRSEITDHAPEPRERSNSDRWTMSGDGERTNWDVNVIPGAVGKGQHSAVCLWQPQRPRFQFRWSGVISIRPTYFTMLKVILKTRKTLIIMISNNK